MQNASSDASAVALVPSVFTERGKQGDFIWETEAAILANAQLAPSGRTLWIFNDNEQDRLTSVVGGQNAAIRPLNRFGAHSAAPLSAGITTGTNGSGYSTLSDPARRVINSDLFAIQSILATGKHSVVKFSSDGSGKLGTNIFVIGDDVNRYIVANLQRVVGCAPCKPCAATHQIS